ncbi:nibrin isoform X1 [Etheostoma spectabile]|uniref:nibrin isoform X1 n=1 Tax=Etheostoma spectabile TaxID=54343 RepID=UPI0013AF8058|nr:nibrin isoform X1 [Etheostoma spectabile]
MWILTPLEAGGETHYLLSNKEYVVGRKNCDILLPNDQSISRAHAHLTATDHSLTLKDTSKYGSFVNNQRLTENTPVNLKSGDNVTFGVFYSKFSVDHQKPVVCSSCLDNDGKVSLSQALLALGGKLVNSWTQDCTHLAMQSAKVTVKTISALLCCRPIVKPEFFLELSKASQQKLPPPKAESFIPEIDEPSLRREDVNLGTIPIRKQLFTGKTFIFLSAKQHKRLSAAVSFGGGRSQLLEEGSLPRDLLESPQSCVIDIATGSSQILLPSSTTEWANSANNIVKRKGLRVIIESEIGLATIYASCDKYCNPSSLTLDSDSSPKVGPRIPSASLSQGVAVDETVLPTTSQNITAYAVNTEPSQGTELSKGTEVSAVGETPENKQNHNSSQLRGSKPVALKTTTQCIVADTMSSSFNTVENTASQRKKPETVSGAASSGIRSQPSLPSASDGMKKFLQKQSPQKQKLPAQASPQKQSALTSFFQTVNKKRPLEDELSSVMSEPKRPVLESAISIQAPNTSAMSKATYSRSDRVLAAASQNPLGSAADLFVGQSDRVSHTVQKEPQSRKRKEMEAEIQMDELESLMSEDMDFFDEQPASNQGQQEQLIMHSSTEQKQGLNTFEAPSSSKRQRLPPEENGKNQRPPVGLEKESGCHKNQTSEQCIVSIKTEQGYPSEYRTTNHESSKSAEVSSAGTTQDKQPFGDDEASFIEDLELLNADICQPEEETKNPPKPVTIKQEVQESKIDDDLPKKLVLVEFRSLTVTAPPKTKPQRMQSNNSAKNFKCFRKICAPGAMGSSHIIGGSDLLVHNRGKHSDLDEWLKDAAEEERQSRRDESVGDDLFRYNPTKLTRRR